MTEPLLIELSTPGRPSPYVAEADVPTPANIPTHLRRSDLPLPELAEVEVVRHFVRLSQQNYAVDLGMYPLGSCTMKYNPKINDAMVRLPGFQDVHPYQPEELVQGALGLMHALGEHLKAITGFDAITLQPAAGAQGELTGLLMVRAYHQQRREGHRDKVLIPDSAHGTNPATATMVGYTTIAIPTDHRGNVDLAALKQAVGPDTAALMITNPNTLGLFEEHILEVTETVHQAGGLVYGDGANLNAILGVVRPRDLGVDILHMNLHKTFSVPHGGGGPGAGPVAVVRELEPYLPVPVVVRRDDGRFALDLDRPHSIGRVKAFHGQFLALVRAYTYLRMVGADGLRAVSGAAVLNANYLKEVLRDHFELPYDRSCMHEFILSGNRQRRLGVRTLDIAKRLIDYGFYPPTIYFPLIVEEALMIEPTETEPKATLDAFAEALRQIAREAVEDPDVVRSAPHRTVVGRLDEVSAARRPILTWRMQPEAGTVPVSVERGG